MYILLQAVVVVVVTVLWVEKSLSTFNKLFRSKNTEQQPALIQNLVKAFFVSDCAVCQEYQAVSATQVAIIFNSFKGILLDLTCVSTFFGHSIEI